MEKIMIQEYRKENQLLGAPINQIQKDLEECVDPEQQTREVERVEVVYKTGGTPLNG